MFTIRFIKHGNRGTLNYVAVSYSTESGEDSVEVRIVLKNGSEHSERVGPEEPYDTAYVANEAGKTVDKITV